MNHGGKTNGYTVPNPVAQGELIQNALKQAHIVPQSLSYMEAHGTGTSLGDPIEIRGLDKAFEGVKKQSCPIGSIKSNLGHLESAAGIAGLTKVLLQFKHKQLVPSIHADILNPNIDFEETPFYVQRELVDWQPVPGYSRRAGISSFGAGGSNAHLILEEAPEAYSSLLTETKPCYLVTLSAKHSDSLKSRIADLYHYLKNHNEVSLEALAYTLNTGRSHFSHRFAIAVSSLTDLKNHLEKLDQGEIPTGYFKGLVEKAPVDGAIYKKIIKVTHEELKNRRAMSLSTYKENLEILANLYVKGYDLDWELLHQDESHQKIRLPTYPFLKERYWLSASSQTTTTHLNPPEESYTVLEKVWKAAPSGVRSQASSSIEHLIIIANKQTAALAQVIAERFNLKKVTLILKDKSNSVSVPNTLQDFLLMDFDKADAGKETGQALLKSCQKGVGLIDLSDLGDDFPTQLNAIPWGKFSLLQQLIANISAPIYVLHITQGLIGWRCFKPSLKGAVMAGLIRSLGAEYGKLQAKTVDIDLPLEQIEAISNLISLEFATDESVGEVCYRNQQRYFASYGDTHKPAFTLFAFYQACPRY